MKKSLKIIKDNLLLSLVVIINVIVLTNNKTISNEIIYTHNKNESKLESTSNELFSSRDINEKLGNIYEIASIGDGTVSGAISSLNNNIDSINNNILELNDKKVVTGHISQYSDIIGNEAVWHFHKSLKDMQSVSANLQIGDNSAIIIGTRVNYKRGIYFLSSRTRDELYLFRITDNGYAYTVFNGTTETVTYSG